MAALALSCVTMLPAEALAQCTSDNDCRGNRRCIQGECREAGCTKDTDCPAPGICKANKCAYPVKRRRARRSRREPVDYIMEKRSMRGLWIAGISVFAAAYFTDIIVTSALDGNVGLAAVPMLGPFLQLDSHSNDDYEAVLILSGIMQIGGMAMFIAGLSIKRTKRIPVYALGDGPDDPLLAVLPGLVGPSGVGVNVMIRRF